MGHERIGVLPKTHPWLEIVRKISTFIDNQEENIAEIAKNTIQNVQSKFSSILYDQGVISAFKFLVIIAVASRSPSLKSELQVYGISVSNITPLSLAKSIQSWLEDKKESFEYAQIAQNAAIDAIGDWFNKNKTFQQSLFGTDDLTSIWHKLGNGSGFCELSRAFFAHFTERYLNYFLEREASAVLNNIEERETFQNSLREHVSLISEHAFETSKITQSFAAGWFNKHAKETIPSDKEIEGFLSFAFGKMKEELLREGDKING